MLRPGKIKNSLYRIVGFNTPTIPLKLTDNTDLVIDSDNLTSYSGIWFDDIPYVSIQNIFDCQENKDITNDQLNAYIKRLHESAILQFCNKVIADQSSFLQNINAFPFEKSFKNTIEPNGRFVGFEFEPKFLDDKVITLPWIELSFDSSAQFHIYLFNSNKKTYVNRMQVTTLAYESKVFNLVDSDNRQWIIADDIEYKGGTWYLGYFEDDLGTAKALKKDYENSNIQLSTRFFDIEACTLNHTSNVLDITTKTETSEVYGLNFGIEVYNDYTEKIIRNKHLFAIGIQQQFAENAITTLKTSNRSNRIRNMMKDEQVLSEINLQLYGSSSAGIEGVKGNLQIEIDKIKKMLFPKYNIIRGTLR